MISACQSSSSSKRGRPGFDSPSERHAYPFWAIWIGGWWSGLVLIMVIEIFLEPGRLSGYTAEFDAPDNQSRVNAVLEGIREAVLLLLFCC